MNTKPPILVFGAGCIGRGLLGELAAKENLPLVFVEAFAPLASALRAAGEFQVRRVGRTESTSVVRNFRVLTLEDTAEIRRALTDCAFAATAVGGMHLERLASRIAPALAGRSSPLNILVCENWPKADLVLAEALVSAGGSPSCFSAVPASVERMVQAIPDSLDLLAESDESAWVDRSKWVGDIQPLEGLCLCDNLKPYYARKLYTNNAGHALLAYEGFLADVATLPEAIGIPSIRERLMKQLGVAAQMLVLEYGLDPAALDEHLDHLIYHRFSNRYLADKVERVARQPLRKLGPNERLIGLLRKLERHGLPIQSVCRTIAAALCYAQSDDPESVLQTVCGLDPDEEAFGICIEEYFRIKNINQGETR